MAKKKARNKGGRPTKMTPLAVKKLEEAFSYGCSDKEACVYAGITKPTLYDYQDKNPEFLDRKELLKEKPILAARQVLMKGIIGKNPDPHLALKFLERKRRSEFSLRHEVIGKDGGPIKAILSDEQAEKIASNSLKAIQTRKKIREKLKAREDAGT